jgi:hypothetical protein
MRGLKTDRTARVVIRGHAFVQNPRRDDYDLAVEVPWGSGWPPRSTNSGSQSEWLRPSPTIPHAHLRRTQHRSVG